MWSGRLGKITVTEHRINPKPGTVYTHQITYIKGPDILAVKQEHYYEQLRPGDIEHANREWVSPGVLAPINDGKVRIFIDYCRLNITTVIDTYPLPQLDYFIDILGYTSLFSTLDANCGYSQIPVAEGNKYKKFFTTHCGTNLYTRVHLS